MFNWRIDDSLTTHIVDHPKMLSKRSIFYKYCHDYSELTWTFNWDLCKWQVYYFILVWIFQFLAQTRPNLNGHIITCIIYLLSLGWEIKSLDTANTCSLWACWAFIVPNVISFGPKVWKNTRKQSRTKFAPRIQINDADCRLSNAATWDFRP